MPVSEKERQQINTLVARFEADTGIQAVAAVIGKADDYPEIPWKAYAFGSALGTLAVMVDPHVLPPWAQTYIVAFYAMTILGTAAVFAITAAFVPAAGRLFLNRVQARGEVHHYARALFLERELFRTESRCCVLILVSRYERAVVILPDSGLAAYCEAADLDRAVAEMTPLLARGQTAAAFESAFDSIKTLLAKSAFKCNPLRGNEIDDAVVVERGA